MGRGLRTVQRWAEKLNLPVHHIRPGTRSPVFAYREDLDQWLRRQAGVSVSNQPSRATEESKPDVTSVLKNFRKLRGRHRFLAYEFEKNKITFMTIDLDAALTLARIAADATDARKRNRNTANARRALDTVEKLFKQSDLPDNERRFIKGKMAEVRAALRQLPHEQRSN